MRKYKDEVPRHEQIRMNQFRLLPGDQVRIQHQRSFHLGEVVEVGSANPEYMLWRQKKTGGKKPEGAEVVRWKSHKKGDREACEQIVRLGGHLSVRLRLKKSMWAVIEILVPVGKHTPAFTHRKKTLYTYDIEKLHREERLVILTT